MPPSGRKSRGKGRNRDGDIGLAVIHHCLRKQAERQRSHNAFVQSLNQEREKGRATLASPPAAVALGGTISRHRTLEFLSGTLGAGNSATGSAHSKYPEQHLRSIIERSGLDEYISTSLAAQETFCVDRYAARLLQEPSATTVVSKTLSEATVERPDFLIEGTDIPIPRRAVLFSRQMAEECKAADNKDHAAGGNSRAMRNLRRRNKARVKLLLSGKMGEATLHNIQFVRQQRDELHRRFQKPKDAKSSKRRSRLAMSAASSALQARDEDTGNDSEDDWEVDSAASGSEHGEREELEEGTSGDSEDKTDTDDASSLVDSSSSSCVASEEEAAEPSSPSHPAAPRLPKTAAELDELELDGFLQWRRMIANMEDDGVILTPFEKNIEVWRQLWRVIERSDLVLQIVDGRSPLFFRCKDLEKYIKEVSSDKRVILVINKSDLLPPAVREEWSQYFAENGVEAVFFSALRELEYCEQSAEKQLPGSARSNYEQESQLKRDDSDVLQRTDETTAESTPAPENRHGETAVDIHKDVISCDLLVKLLLKYREEFFSKRRLDGDTEHSEDFVVGTVGYPNVGKSSLINALLNVKKVSVSQQPGKTRRLQTIPLKGKGIVLCDCPGLVFPKAVSSKHILVLNGVVPIDEMRGDYLPSVQLICDAIPHTLVRHYGITADAYRAAYKTSQYNSGPSGYRNAPSGSFDRIEALYILAAIASHRHFVSGGKGGQLDLYRVATMILRDFTAGRLRRCHLPKGAVYGKDEETANIETFLAAVRSSVETRIAGAGSSKVVAWPAKADIIKGKSGNGRSEFAQMDPVDVLHELEQDADLLEVLGGGGNTQTTGDNTALVMTKRKARQLQKQMLKGKGKGSVGGLPCRL